MGRAENLEVFNDTEKMCKENAVLKDAIKNSTKEQKLILEYEELNVPELKKYNEPAKIVVSKKRSYEAASAYKDLKTVVHNFASASNPGGGVTKGSSAQEECLCRCSTLYFNLNTKEMWNGFYSPHRYTKDPIHNDDCIYTPDVVVFKTDTDYPKTMKESDWYKVDVITCAAPNLRQVPSNGMNSGDGDKSVELSSEELHALHEKRMRRILNICVNEGAEAVILGAFGCGAFRNEPEVVAQAMKNVIKDYLNSFKVIEFAVYCSPKDDSNFRTFDRVLKNIT